KAIGIDLGTTFSCVAVMERSGRIEVVSNNYGNKITPSVVHFGGLFKEVGEEAQQRRGSDPKNTVFQIKRFMGRSPNDSEITKRVYPFEVLSTRKGEAAIRVTPIDENATGESKMYSPEQISAYILGYMKALAQKHIGNDVKDAVITVPANFNNEQRQATKDAGEMAGLNVLRIINEPTAAALAYGYGKNSQEERTVLVYDLGGGTFDVSIVRCRGLEAKVLSTAGLTDLGGEDFNNRIFEDALAQFKTKRFSLNSEEEFALYESCESAKRSLSVVDKTKIEFYQNGIGHEIPFTREEFEELCMDLFEKTIECVDDAVKQSGCDKSSIDDIVLVGGSSRIPRVQQMIQEFFGNKDLMFDIPPDHAVAHGAAILSLSTQNLLNSSLVGGSIRGAVKLADVLPFSLGTNITYGRFSLMLKRNTQYPASNTSIFYNATDYQTLLKFKILEGESALSRENNKLGKCEIPIEPKIVHGNKIAVTFSVDENGILSVRLRDEDTGNEASTKVQTSRLSDNERLKMVRNAREEEEKEEIEKKKYEARTAFADALMKAKRSVHKTDDNVMKMSLQTLISNEENWIESRKNHSNDELIDRAVSVRRKIDTVM
ncbi:hypothetical protein PFISCL1PPCAC_23600, partial [Pristionchus fissidentatus]